MLTLKRTSKKRSLCAIFEVTQINKDGVFVGEPYQLHVVPTVSKKIKQFIYINLTSKLTHTSDYTTFRSIYYIYL